MGSKLNAEDLYNEFLDHYDGYNSHRKAAFKARLTRLAKKTDQDAFDAQYLDTMAARIGVDLPYGETKPHSFMLPIYKIQLVRDSSHASDRKQVRSPSEAALVLSSYMAGLDREHLVVIMFDTRMNIIGINTVGIGTLTATLVSPREVFKPALLSNAASIMLAHNHPSGDPTPSPEDVHITKALAQAGDCLDVCVNDHIIIGENGRYVSLKERGLF